MRRMMMAVLGVALLWAGDDAYAQSLEIGEGKNGSCPDEACFPSDPTAGQSNLLPDDSGLYLSADGSSEDMSGGAAVAVGDEDQAGSVGRVSVYLSADGATIYVEDYSEGDMFADAIENTDQALGCVLLACDPNTDSPNDAAAIHIG